MSENWSTVFPSCGSIFRWMLTRYDGIASMSETGSMRTLSIDGRPVTDELNIEKCLFNITVW